MSFCSQCGAKNADGAKFCTSCGNPMAAIPAQPVAPAAPAEPVQPAAPVEQVAPVAPVQPAAPAEPAAPVEFTAPVQPAAPQYQTPVYQAPAYQPPVTPAAAPKKSHTGLWVALTCGVLLVGLVIALVVLLSGGGKSQLAKAADKTMDALAEAFAMDSMEELADNLEKIEKSGAMTEKFILNAMDEYGDGMNMEFAMDFDLDAKAASGYLQMATNFYGTSGHVTAEYSVDDDVMMIGMPQLFDGALAMNMKTLGEDARGSWLAENTGMEISRDLSLEMFPDGKDADLAKALEKACGKQYKAFLKSVELVDGEKQDSGTVYTVTADPEAAADLVEAFVDFYLHDESMAAIREQYNMSMNLNGINVEEFEDMMEEQMEQVQDAFEELPLQMQVAIRKDGYLTGIRLVEEMTMTSVEFTLLGDKNPWEEFEIRVDAGYDAVIVEGGVKSRKGDVEFTLKSYEEDYPEYIDFEMCFSLEDNGDFALSAGDSYDGVEKILSGNLSTKDGGMSLTLDFDTDDVTMEICVELLPLEYKPSQVSDDPMNIFEMGESDWMKLVTEIQENGMNDPGFMGLMEAFS